MTSKQRVLTAIERQTPDRTPVDFWAEPDVKRRLIEFFGLEDEEELLRRFNVDLRCIYPPYIGPELKTFDDGSFEDFWGVIRKPVSHATGIHYEVCYSPLAEAKTVRDVEECRWPDPDWFDYSSLRQGCERYQDYAIVLGKMGRESQTIFIQTWYSRGLGRIMTDMSDDPGLVKAIVSKIMNFRTEHVTCMLEAASGQADILQLADDYGTQNGLMMSPDMWCEFFGPSLKCLADLAHQYGLKVFLHSCGSVRELVPDLIDIGIDILNPIQVRARGMDPRELKKTFGRDLCFHGSIDTQHTLPFGSRADVVEEVRDRIEVLGDRGGFILAPTHTIEPDTPLENVVAMYEAAERYGRGRTAREVE